MAIIGTLPYSIAAGQLISAAPVMGNYNYIVSQVNANATTNTAIEAILAAGTGASLIGYTPPGTGAVATNVGAKFQEWRSIRDFGAVQDGVTDDAASFTAAISAGVKNLYVPPSANGTKFSTFTMPTPGSANYGFTIFGEGWGSKLIQSGAGIVWPTNATPQNCYHRIKDLVFDGTSGTGHTINTSGAQIILFENLLCLGIPPTYDFLHIDGSATNYGHDFKAAGIYVYSTTAGHAGIGLGPKCSDTNIDKFLMNGTNNATYCLFIGDGAQTTKVTNSNPYSAVSATVYGSATSTAVGFSFLDCVIGSSSAGPNVSLSNFQGTNFLGTYIQGVPLTQIGVLLNNCNGTNLIACEIDGVFNATSMVKETGTSDYTNIIGLISDNVNYGTNPATIANFTAPFNLIGAHSQVQNFPGYNPLGQQFTLGGVGQSTIGGGVTTYLGVNGLQASGKQTAWCIPGQCTARGGVIAVDVAPGAGQSFTFNIVWNGSTTIGTPIISGAASFSATFTLGQAMSSVDTLWIQCVASGGAAAATPRYAINFTG
jgi:hypothetical protein